MIAEPVTLATDYALALACFWLGARLWRAREAQRARAFWTAAILALALGALLGGTHHGFAPWLGAFAYRWLWYATVVAVGIASAGMVAGSAFAVTSGPLRQVLVALAGAKLVLFTLWMLAHEEFIWVIADTGAALAAVAALHGFSAWRTGDAASRWLLGGVAVSIGAALVQASGFALHPHFNHNDLYHVIQIGAMWLLWRGASGLRDA